MKNEYEVYKEKLNSAIATNNKAWWTAYKGVWGWSLLLGYSLYKLVAKWEVIGALGAQGKTLKALREISSKEEGSE